MRLPTPTAQERLRLQRLRYVLGSVGHNVSISSLTRPTIYNTHHRDGLLHDGPGARLRLPGPHPLLAGGAQHEQGDPDADREGHLVRWGCLGTTAVDACRALTVAPQFTYTSQHARGGLRHPLEGSCRVSAWWGLPSVWRPSPTDRHIVHTFQTTARRLPYGPQRDAPLPPPRHLIPDHRRELRGLFYE